MSSSYTIYFKLIFLDIYHYICTVIRNFFKFYRRETTLFLLFLSLQECSCYGGVGSVLTVEAHLGSAVEDGSLPLGLRSVP